MFNIYNNKKDYFKMKESVGILIFSKDTNNFLLLHRINNPIVWSVLSGKMDKPNEKPLDTIKREIKEEIGLNPELIKDIKKVGILKDSKIFHLFIGYIDNEFTPKLQVDELDGYGWYNETNLPKPIHKRWPETFHLIKKHLQLVKETNNIIKKFIK